MIGLPCIEYINCSKMLKIMIKTLRAYFEYKYPQFAVSSQTMLVNFLKSFR